MLASLSFSYCVILQCEFRTLGDNQYTCDSANITDDGNLTHVLSITGSHQNGETNADVTSIWVSNHQVPLTKIPKNIEKFFVNLKSFSWIQGNLTTLIADDLKPFVNLDAFWSFMNPIVSLDGDLFMYNKKLTSVSFNYNQLEIVGYGLLDGLQNLTTAWFIGNPCISFYTSTPSDVENIKVELRKCLPNSRKTEEQKKFVKDEI